MELAVVLLLTVLGGGALLVGLIIAIVTGSSRSERLRKLESEQGDLRTGLHEAHRRINGLEQELRQERYRLESLRAEVATAGVEPRRAAIEAHPAAIGPRTAATDSPTAPTDSHLAAIEPRRVATDLHTAATDSHLAAIEPRGVATDSHLAATDSHLAPTGSPTAPTDSHLAATDSPTAATDLHTSPTDSPTAEAAPQWVDAAPHQAGPVIPSWPAQAPEAPADLQAAAAVAAAPVEQPFAAPPAADAPLPVFDSEPPSARPPPARFDWERWVGVRGAAALGACVLVIAALYFFKYSLDHGLISPALRVVLGTMVGLGGVIASEVMLRRRYTPLANWLGGAGIAILYTSFWAANALYQLVGTAPSFALMTLVTVTCGLLAMRHDAMVIALLGLLGGFITPLALSTGEDHPFGLFGYLLMLDSALLYLSVKRRWPILGALSLLGTFFYQAAWIGERMGPERAVLGMGIVVVFGALYGLSLPEPKDDEGKLWPLTRAAAVLLPFGFGFYFGLRNDLGPRFLPLGMMLVILTAGAAWMARARRTAWVGPAAAMLAMSVSAAWMLDHDHAAIAWEVAGMVAAIGAVLHAFRELERARPSAAGPEAAAAAAGTGALAGLFVLVLAAIMPSSRDPWPWLSGWLALGGMALRQSFLGSPKLRLGVALMIALGVPMVHLIHDGQSGFPGQLVYLSGIAVVVSLALVAAAMLRREGIGAAASAEPDGEAPSVPAGVPVGGASRDGGVILVSFAFALYFAARTEVTEHPAPLAAMLALLAAGAALGAQRTARVAWLPLASSIAGLVVLATWLAVHFVAYARWEATGLVCLFAAGFHAVAEIAARSRSEEESGSALADAGAVVASLGGMVLLLGTAASRSVHVPWELIAGVLVLAAFVLRQARAPGRAALPVAAALVLGLGLPIVHGVHSHDADYVPSSSAWIGLGLALAIAASALAQLAPEGPRRRWSSHAAALLAMLLLANAFDSDAPPVLLFGVTLALIALSLVSAARLGHGGWAFAAAIWGALVQLSVTLATVPERGGEAARPAALVALFGQLATVGVIAAWPVIAARRFQADAWAWRAAALAGPLWFASLHHVWTALLGNTGIGLLPLILGAIAAGVATRARAVLPADGPLRRSALVWLLAVALCSISIAIPLQLENEWITVGWALEGVALLALWQRMDHAGLKYTALAHLAVVAIRLGLNPSVLDYHPRGGLPVLNWLLYTYWIPAGALVGAWRLLRDLEVPRARGWEAALYATKKPLFALASAASAIVLGFLWVNLTIFDAFGEGTELHVAFDRMPARDLTLSMAWAVYALILLGLGMARRSAALRWTSLALIIITAGKAFLYDLAHLHDLYRVMSLVGLALSLILISLAYQRFVFRKRDEEVS